MTGLNPGIVFVGEAGPQGPIGPAGTIWLAGTGAPSSGIGVDGDFFYRTDTNQIYRKASGTWSVIVTFVAGGGGDLIAANNLSDVPNKTTARSNLGLAIGTNVQAYDADLAAIAGLTSAANKLPYFTGAGTAATTDFTAAARSLLDDADATAMRATLGLVIGTNVQAHEAKLAALSALSPSADQIPYFTGASTITLASLTAAARSLLDDGDVGTMRATLGLTIGTNVQAYDADLAAIASLTSAADQVPYFTGAGTASTMTVTAAARALLDDPDFATMRTTLGASAVPTGSIIPFGGGFAPSGWLFCDGSNQSRTTYATLYAVLGDVFGAGDGSTTFGLPDLRGRVVAGKDNMGGTTASRLTAPRVTGTTLGAVGGAETHTLLLTEIPAHTHSTGIYASGGSSPPAPVAASATRTGSPYDTSSQGSGTAHNNVQPTMILNYIIKT